MTTRSILIQQYLDEHDLRCAVCHSRGDSWNDSLEVHHVFGRHKNKDLADDHRNLILLCRDCHHGYHSGGGCSLDLGHVLTAKTEVDGSVDIPFLAGLRGRVGLRDDPKPLPDWALAARVDNK